MLFFKKKQYGYGVISTCIITQKRINDIYTFSIAQKMIAVFCLLGKVQKKMLYFVFCQYLQVKQRRKMLQTVVLQVYVITLHIPIDIKKRRVLDYIIYSQNNEFL